MRKLPSTIVALGLVSFLTDLSSEMIYPLLPVFIALELGGGAVALGFVEGIAEATAALGKAFSGLWTDRTGKRLPFLLGGYGLSGVARPLIGLALNWPMVAVIRLADRVGKGLRTSPRDALIASVAHPQQLGHAFGFHRSMDHAGAVVGPLLAAWLLSQQGVSMRHVFLLAAIPAAAVLLVLFYKVKEPAQPSPLRPHEVLGPRVTWSRLGRDYKVFLAAVLVFTLGNSADAFLLLRLSEAGAEPSWLAVLWAAHHMVKMTANFYCGRLSDKLGRRLSLLAGWALYAAAYLAFGQAQSEAALTLIFLLYGFYYGFAEPAERSLVAELAPNNLIGSAFGLYHGVVGLMALPASLIFGLIYKFWGPAAAFTTGAVLAGAAGAILYKGLGWAEGSRS